jgi:hypothetical protein
MSFEYALGLSSQMVGMVVTPLSACILSRKQTKALVGQADRPPVITSIIIYLIKGLHAFSTRDAGYCCVACAHTPSVEQAWAKMETPLKRPCRHKCFEIHESIPDEA